MYETPYAVLEPDTPYPRPEIGSEITFVYELNEGGEHAEVEVEIRQILFDLEGWAKVLGRTTRGNCATTVFFRHTEKKSGSFSGRIVISDECSP